MKIIILSGQISCGKTTTLNLVYQMVLSAGGNSTNKKQLGGDPHDFADIVAFQGKQVAFFTMGDYAREIIAAIDEYAKKNVDTLVLACNNRFVTPYRKAAQYAPYYLINKAIAVTPQNRIQANTSDANAIWGMLP